MPSQKKINLQEDYSSHLSQSPNIILTRYSGLTVAQLTTLRGKLREKGVVYKVVKNNIFQLALKASQDLKDFPYDSTFEGPLAVAFANEDVPGAAKVLKEYAKEQDKLQIVAGVMEQTYYDANGVEAIANLPSKEQLLATLAASLNSPATKIAGLVNNIMASLARAINAVGEKNG
ncbi:MAG: 50S ribosomal protein L10 [Leptospiraceae bacterium]|nr:50S ribosomal protein L10 [Leptospiraceae bacterium]